MPTTLARPLAAAAAVAALALTVPALAQCGSCGDHDAQATADQFISTEAPSTRPADDADAMAEDARPAEEMLADLQAAQSIEEALPIVREFVEAHPDHEAAPQMMYLAAQYAETPEEQKALYQRLVDDHGDTQFGQMAQGTLKQMEKVGQPFELTFEEAVTGEEISVQDDLAGKVVVIDFWATWCGPCIAELPHMKELYEQYKDQGVEFVGVSLDAPPSEGGRDALLEFVEERELPWPQYYQGNGWDSEFSKSWGINSIPAIFVVDASGKLHSTDARGKLDEMIPELIKQRDDAQASAE